MKKYVMLFSFTVMAIGGILLAKEWKISSIPTVSTVKVTAITAENTVICGGKVERVTSKTIYAPASSIINEVYVKSGQTIRAGSPLLKVTLPVHAPLNPEGSMQEVYTAFLKGEDLSGFAKEEESPSYQVITAPIDGIISDVSAVANTVSDTATPAVTIEGTDGLQVRLPVNESIICDVQTGQTVEITGTGFKDSVYLGKVKNISSEAKQIMTSSGQETVVDVLVQVENADEDLKPGFSAKAKIITEKKSNVMLAPYEAIQADEDGTEFVYCLSENRAVKTYVTSGEEYENGVELVQGISPGDIIILNPEQISDSAAVMPIEYKGGTAPDV